MPQQEADISICVLAGGQSTRLNNKLFAPIHGEALLARVVRRMSGRYPLTVCIAPETLLPPLPPDVQIIPEQGPRIGPLGGLLAAFPHLRAAHIFVVAGDAPNVHASMVAQFAEKLTHPLQAIVGVSEGRIQPLLGLYDRIAFLDASRKIQTNAVREVVALLETGFVEVPQTISRSINTAEDYAQMVCA